MSVARREDVPFAVRVRLTAAAAAWDRYLDHGVLPSGIAQPKLFIVQPGVVRSINDWDEHRITAAQLMRLYEVQPRECIVDDGRLGWWDRDRVARMLRLTPLATIDYRPVTRSERERLLRDLYPELG